MTDITPIRYSGLNSIDVTMPSLADATYSIDVTNSSGTGSGAFTIGVPATGGDITRTIQPFDRLYWMVKISRTDGGLWNNIPATLPTTTDVFRICSISDTSFYGQVADTASVVDWGLDLSSIDNSFSGLPFEKPLAKIPSFNFSIDNMELIYHQLCEANGGDLNIFQSAEVEVYMCNGLIPSYFWNGAQWENELGQNWLYQPSNPGASYPANDGTYLAFKGIINKIDFSVKTTSFSAVGIADKNNNKMGTLSSSAGDPKGLGDIIPITYGDWSKQGDLAPLVLEGQQNNTPRLILSDRDNFSFSSARLYDKVSELDYRALGDVTAIDANTKVSFTDPTPVAVLQKNVAADAVSWDNGYQLDAVKSSTIPTQGQLTIEVDGEQVAFHDRFPKFFGFDKSASRAWGNTPLEAHSTTDNVLQMNETSLKAKATIKVDLIPSGYHTGDSANGGGSGGSLSQTLLNDDPTDQDQTMSNYYYRSGMKAPAVTSLERFFDADYYMTFKESGFNGVVTDYTMAASVLSRVEAGFRIGVNPFDLSCDIAFVTPDSSYVYNLNNNGSGVSTEFDFTQWSQYETNANAVEFNDLTFGFRPVLLATNLLNPTNEDMWFSLNYFKGEATLEIFADNGVWFWRGKGRINSGLTLIEKPVEILDDIAEFELLSTNTIIDSAPNRQDWKAAPSIYGKQQEFRKWLDGYLLDIGCGGFNNAAGDSVIFDLEKKVTPDYSILQTDILDNGGVQAVNYSFTDRSNLYNEFIIKFRPNPANKQFLNVLQVNDSSSTSTEEWAFFTSRAGLENKCALATSGLGFNNGETRQFIYEADSIRDQRTAEQLLQFFINFHHLTTAIVEVKGIFTKFYNLELGDQVDFSDVGGLPSKISNAQYIIIGKRINPSINGKKGSIDLKMMEVQF
jgi:hypothetical protein